MVVELVRVGGVTGHLEPVLTRAAEALERRRQLQTSMLTALAYPTIVLLAAFGVTGFMVLSVIPKLEKFLSTIGRRLPPMTQLLMDITHGIQTYLPYGLALGAVLAAAVIGGCFWPPSRIVIDRLVLRIPLVGTIFRLAGTVAFAGNLGALLHSGIRILEGLRTVERLQRNQFLALQIAQAREAVMHGTNLAAPLATPHAFMPMLSRMVAVGESAGTLDEVLAEVARFYESQLQSTIRRLSVIVEPVIIIVVGGIVGFVYISFFMALFAAGRCIRRRIRRRDRRRSGVQECAHQLLRRRPVPSQLLDTRERPGQRGTVTRRWCGRRRSIRRIARRTRRDARLSDLR
jgi:type IV pilus assembly protein PilC